MLPAFDSPAWAEMTEALRLRDDRRVLEQATAFELASDPKGQLWIVEDSRVRIRD